MEPSRTTFATLIILNYITENRIVDPTQGYIREVCAQLESLTKQPSQQ
jgi:hypothetical protein